MQILKTAYDKAVLLLRENMEALDRIAEYLIEHETITGKQFMKIFYEVKGIPCDEDGKPIKDQEESNSAAANVIILPEKNN